MPFRPEPAFQHGQPARVGVLLCNLGTPDEPTAAATRRYLAEFLSDPRVIEIPRAVWKPILHGLILRTRPAKSAAKYRTIWTPEGSPLLVWSRKQAIMLRGYLGERGHDVEMRLAMRYGNPSVASQLDELRAQGCTRILVVPLYPQYSGTTTASVFDAVAGWAQQARHVPELRFVNRFHDDPGYIRALAHSVQQHWQAHGRPDKLVVSFHGVPERTLTLGDPYHCECLKTARLLAERLALKDGEWVVSFQSRFGKAKWLEPATQTVLEQLGRAGTHRVDLVCPGFIADCLETLEEIAIEGQESFKAAGGQEFHYIPCLNDDPVWLAALSEIVQDHLQGWPTRSGDDSAAASATRDRALAAGAKA
ncbi:ferrochelatase [Ottowia sp. SB7-C50]|uniref:ferrochelatase n=1 Tax=Ottowia sp. SB7-C50 TaxID=3081231 RepID=UPI002953AF17|nr:ferrochelatase [Ottowia sp. SB7-C50]WOP16386.1 ferrochelatase [Ottowia sp. SB7-C50]